MSLMTAAISPVLAVAAFAYARVEPQGDARRAGRDS